MNTLIKNCLALFTLLCAGGGLFAQTYLHQVIILSEGRYDYVNLIQDVPVIVGSYDPVNETYIVFDTITGSRFASDVVVDGDFIYVAADDKLIKYDKFTLQRTKTQTVDGIRKIAIWNNQILVTRGQFLVDYISYFQVFNKNDLSLKYDLDSLSGPYYSTEGIAVINDSAFIAINNGYKWPNYVGLIGVVDLNNQKYVREIDLGPNGINPDNLMSDSANIYTLNNKDFSGSSVSSYAVGTGQVVTTNLPIASGCGTSALVQDKIYYQDATDDQWGLFSVVSNITTDTVDIDRSLYGMGVETLNSVIYTCTTDFVTFGKVLVYNFNGVLIDSFEAGVSVGNFGFDYRQQSGIKTNESKPLIHLFPNPAADHLTIAIDDIGNNEVNLEILDMLGKVHQSEIYAPNRIHKLNVQELPSGLYFIRVINGLEMQTIKFVKE